MHILSDKYCYYHYISVNEVKNKYSIIADTQVAINLEKFFYNPIELMDNKDKDRKYLATMDYLIETINQDIIYGFAMQEACWDYAEMSINYGQYTKMETALQKQYNWNIDKIKLNTLDTKREFLGKCEREKIKEFESILNQTECNPNMLISYVCIMKLYVLFKTVKNKITAYEYFIKFLEEELLCSMAIESYLAVSLFCGQSTSLDLVQKILKFGEKKTLKQMWSSCWDISFIRLIINEVRLKQENDREVVLVSADEGIILLAKFLNITGFLKNEVGILTINSFKMENIILEYEKQVENINKIFFYNYEKIIDKRKAICNYNEYVFSLIKKLEETVKILNKK